MVCRVVSTFTLIHLARLFPCAERPSASLFVDRLGFIALSIESTLPIPQFLSNFSRKTCHGFRSSTLAGWLGGDIFKTGYFFVKGSPLQFKVTALMTVCFDLGEYGIRNGSLCLRPWEI